MYINEITSKDLKIQVHHIGGIGECGPTEIITDINQHTFWTFYDADKNSLDNTTGTKNKEFVLINKCIGKEDGKGIFNIMKHPSASSLLKSAKSAKDYIVDGEEETWGERTVITGTEEVGIHKLQTLIDNKEVNPVDFLSVDAQGTDLDIIEGTDMSEVVAVLCEAELSQLYEGQPLFQDVLKKMHEEGFRLCFFFNPQSMKVRKYPPSSGFLTVSELFFLKDYKVLLYGIEELSLEERTKKVIQLLKLAMISITYDQADYAMIILEELENLIDLAPITNNCKDSFMRQMLAFVNKVRERKITRVAWNNSKK